MEQEKDNVTDRLFKLTDKQRDKVLSVIPNGHKLIDFEWEFKELRLNGNLRKRGSELHITFRNNTTGKELRTTLSGCVAGIGHK